MEILKTVYGGVLLLAAVAMVALAAVLRQQHNAASRRTFLALVMIFGARLALDSLTLLRTDLSGSSVLRDAKYACDIVLPVVWLSFVLLYTRSIRQLSRPLLAALLVIPAITAFLTLTNPWHGLVWSAGGASGASALPAQAERGDWFWIQALYSAALIAASIVALTSVLVRSVRHHRAQFAMLLIGAAFVLLGMTLLGPLLDTVLYLVVALLAGVAIAVGIRRYRLLGIVPVARATIIEELGNPFIVLDTQQRVMDMNAAAYRLISSDRSDLIGEPFSEVFAGWPELIHLAGHQTESGEVTVQSATDPDRWFGVRMSDLQDPAQADVGRLILISDISERKRAEDRERQAAYNALTLSDISRVIAEVGLSYTQLLDTIAQLMAERIGDVCAIITLSEGRVVLASVVCHHGAPDRIVAAVQSVAGRPLAADADAAAPAELMTAGIQQYDGDALRRMLHAIQPEAGERIWQAGIHSALIAPLRGDGQAPCLLALGRHEPHPPYSPGERTLIQDVAERAALAIDNARLYHIAQRELGERERAVRTLQRRLSLERMASSLSSRFVAAGTDDVEDQMRRSVRAVGQALDADRCFAALFEPGQFSVSRYYEWRAPEQAEWTAAQVSRMLLSSAGLTDALASQGPARISGPGDWQDAGAQSVIVFPLRASQALVGCFGLCTAQAGRQWPDEDVDLLQVLSSQLASLLGRARAEQALQNSEQILRGLIDHSLDAICMADERGNIIEWNPSLERISALARAQVIGKPLWEIIVPVFFENGREAETIVEFRETVQQMLRGQATTPWFTSTERRVQDTDASRRWVEHVIFPIPTAKGKMLANIIRDISERKLGSDRLRQQAAYLETLIESSVSAIISCSRDGTVLSWNRAAEMIYGWSRDEVVGRAIPATFQTPAEITDDALHQEAVAGRPVYHAEVRRRRADHADIVVLASASPIRAGDGSITGVLDISTDITDKRHLDEQVNQRRTVRAAMEERERLARELHDSLGQNLSYVKLQALAVRDALDAGAVDNAQALLRRLTEVAQNTQVEMRTQIRGLFGDAVEGASFVTGLSEFLAEFRDRFKIDTVLATAPAFSATLLDHDTSFQLFRILQEALTNAGRHSQASRISVALTAEEDCIAATVEDNGKGFSVQGAGESGTDHFGLRIMRQRARDIGADLRIESAPAHGTTVLIQLPLRARTAADHATAT